MPPPLDSLTDLTHEGMRCQSHWRKVETLTLDRHRWMRVSILTVSWCVSLLSPLTSASVTEVDE